MKRLQRLDYWFPLVVGLLLFTILLVVCYAVYLTELQDLLAGKEQEIATLKETIEELEKTRIVISR